MPLKQKLRPGRLTSYRVGVAAELFEELVGQPP